MFSVKPCSCIDLCKHCKVAEGPRVGWTWPQTWRSGDVEGAMCKGHEK